jgi:hypothetical protein
MKTKHDLNLHEQYLFYLLKDLYPAKSERQVISMLGWAMKRLLTYEDKHMQ